MWLIMKRFRRRTLTLSLIATLAVTIAVVVSVAKPDSSQASPIREATPLAQANFTKIVQKGIARAASTGHVKLASILELGGATARLPHHGVLTKTDAVGASAGQQDHAVLVGTDTSGATVLAFLDGFGMSAFVPGDTFVNDAKPMFVSDTVSGPSTQAQIVGLTGITTLDVARVTVQLANGTTLTLPLAQAQGVAYQGFAYVSSDAATFPSEVTAYNANGDIAAQHNVDARALCPSSQPDCGG
jgi:hypothetical protein